MSDTPEHPQLYLITPPVFEADVFPDVLARCLDAVDVACLRLTLATTDERDIMRAADALREITHARDIPLVIENHAKLVEPLGLDGVHLSDGSRSVLKVRKLLGEDAVVGAHCAASSHDGMTAGELGADYVSFGPVGATDLGTAETAEADLFKWWSQMIELPVVAEGALSVEHMRNLAPHTDFFALGGEIWGADDPTAELVRLRDAMKG